MDGSRPCLQAKPRRRSHRFKPQLPQNHQKVVMAAAAMQAAQVANQVTGVRKAVVMAVARVAKAAVRVVDVVDAVVVAELTAKVVRSGNASMQKPNPCLPMPICRM